MLRDGLWWKFMPPTIVSSVFWNFDRLQPCSKLHGLALNKAGLWPFLPGVVPKQPGFQGRGNTLDQSPIRGLNPGFLWKLWWLDHQSIFSKELSSNLGSHNFFFFSFFFLFQFILSSLMPCSGLGFIWNRVRYNQKQCVNFPENRDKKLQFFRISLRRWRFLDVLKALSFFESF